MTYVGGTALSIVLELDPNVVKPGWTPLLITVGLALVMVLLFRSMKRQFSRVHTNFPEPAATVDRADSDAASVPSSESTADGSTAAPEATGEDRAPRTAR